MILPTTLTIAGACALLHIWFSARVGQLRRGLKISVGDGGNEALLRRMRAHANFTENVPIFLVLLAVLELARVQPIALWAAAILFVIARILHAFGMDRPSPSPLRTIGAAASLVLLLALAGWAIVTAYQSPGLRGGFTLSPAQSAELSAPAVPPEAARR